MLSKIHTYKHTYIHTCVNSISTCDEINGPCGGISCVQVNDMRGRNLTTTNTSRSSEYIHYAIVQR